MKRKKKVIIIGIGIIVLLSSILSIVIYNANYNSIDIQQANKGWTIYDKSITNIKENMSIITEADGYFEWGSLKDFEIEDKDYEKTLNSLVVSVRMCYLSYTDDGTLYTNANPIREYRNKKTITKTELKELNYSIDNEKCFNMFTQYNSLFISHSEELTNEVYNITNKIIDLKANDLFSNHEATYEELLLRKILEVHLVEDVSEYLVKEYDRLK